MKVILDILGILLVGFIVVAYWVYVVKKIRQYFGRPYYDDPSELNKADSIKHKSYSIKHKA